MTMAAGLSCPVCLDGRTLVVGGSTLAAMTDAPDRYTVEHRVECPTCGRRYVLATVCRVVRSELRDLHGTTIAVSDGTDRSTSGVSGPNQNL